MLQIATMTDIDTINKILYNPFQFVGSCEDCLIKLQEKLKTFESLARTTLIDNSALPLKLRKRIVAKLKYIDHLIVVIQYHVLEGDYPNSVQHRATCFSI